MAAIAKICFHALIVPKPYVPHQNSSTKGTSLGCRLVPEIICIARNCAIWAVPLSQTHLKSTHFQLFWRLVKPLGKNSESFQRFTHAHTDSHLYFKNAHNQCRIIFRESALYSWQKKHVLAFLDGTHGAISTIFCVRTFTPHLYSRFHPDPFSFGEDITEKPLHGPRSKCNTSIGLNMAMETWMPIIAPGLAWLACLVTHQSLNLQCCYIHFGHGAVENAGLLSLQPSTRPYGMSRALGSSPGWPPTPPTATQLGRRSSWLGSDCNVLRCWVFLIWRWRRACDVRW